MSELNLWVNISLVILGIISAVINIIALVRTLIRKKYNWALTGQRAVAKFNKINETLKNPLYFEEHEYTGSKNKIFPQLKSERYMDNIKEPELNKCKFTITYYVVENDKRMEKVWYLK